jgi:hypothetical protein
MMALVHTDAVHSVTANAERKPVTQDGIATNGSRAEVAFDEGEPVLFSATDAHYLAYTAAGKSRRLFDAMDRLSLAVSLDEYRLEGSVRTPQDTLVIFWLPKVVRSIWIGRSAVPPTEFISEPTLGELRLRLPKGMSYLRLEYERDDPNRLPGWPVDLNYSYVSSPVLTDMDGDGADEVVVGAGRTEKNMLVLKGAGKFLQGWPQGTAGEIASSPAVGDIDGDEDPEIVVGSFGAFDEKERLYDGWVHAWHADGKPVTGWPVRAGWGIESTPALADLDADGKLDVVIGSTDCRVYAWRGDASPLPGWPQQTGGIVTSSPAVGDIDADGIPEVVSGCGDGNVYVWGPRGRAKPGWPHSTGLSIESSPALADLDNDVCLEVIVGSNDGAVYVLDAQGRPLRGWPQKTGGPVRSSAAVADLDGDGRPEIVSASWDHGVYVWRTDGRRVKGWPQFTGGPVKSSPILVDIDGDGQLDILVGAHDSRVWAWHASGEPVPGWPKTTLLMNMATPAAGDIDGDGMVEIIAPSFNVYHGKIFGWRCPAMWNPRWVISMNLDRHKRPPTRWSPPGVPWPSFRGNALRTGVASAHRP